MTDEFLLMVKDCIEFARDGLSAKDYQEFCKRMLGPGTSYYDRMRVAERLVDEQVIYLDANKFHLGELEARDWLVSGLAKGNVNAWNILDSFPKRRLKFDPDNAVNAEIGLAGEEAVMSWLYGSIDASRIGKINHISLVNDAAGYDIFSPSTKNFTNDVLLEVKTTTRPGPAINIFLSRNEARVGIQNQNWFLTFVSIVNGISRLEGHLSINEILFMLPKDPIPESSWMSVKLKIEKSSLNPGLP